MFDIATLETVVDGLPLVNTSEAAQDDTEYVLVATPIDKFTVKRTRIKRTPAVCIFCGFDAVNYLVRNNRAPNLPYDELTEQAQLVAQQIVEIHKQQVHSIAERQITKGRPNRWLGGTAK